MNLDILLENPEYMFFVANVKTSPPVLETGWEYRSDAQDYIDDWKGMPSYCFLRIWSRKFCLLSKHGI
jgi:hypothetical protein